MLFSIIVPIYNVGPYLERCIAHLRGQTYSNIEIILVDDESPDNCPQMCDEFAEIDERIKVIHKKNGGLSDARNKGLEIATGEYVLFVDSDDYIERNTCERLCRFAQKSYDILIGDAIVEGGVCRMPHIPIDNMLYTGKDYLKKALKAGKAPMAAWLNAYKRRFLLDNELFFKFGILHEDEQFTPRAFLKANSVIYTGITFYHYIIRDGSITTKNDKRKNMKDLFSTCCELEGIYNALDDSELKKLLLDSLVVKYLNMFQVGKLYQYGKEYTYTDFIKKNAYGSKTKAKTTLFCFNQKCYWWINTFLKSIKRL